MRASLLELEELKQGETAALVSEIEEDAKANANLIAEDGSESSPSGSQA